VPVVVRDDVEAAADVIRPHLALYAGGMGSKEANFHKASLDRLGYASALDEVQELYLAGRKQDAARAVPTELVEEIALVGPAAKVARDLARWEGTALTTMLLQGDPSSMLTVLAASQAARTDADGATPLAARVRAAAGGVAARVAPTKA